MPLALEHISYTYAPGTPFETPALAEINISIKDGEFIGLMGHTGSGKSTLIQLMAGLLRPDAGRVLLDGRDINERGYQRELLRRQVGIVFQYPEHQLFELTVEKDVAFGLRRSGLTAGEIAERVRGALQEVGFDFAAVRELSPLGLSGGEKRKVAIAGVLAMRPRLLILDEPIAGLDPCTRLDFMEFFRRLNQDGVTVLMVSHNVDELAEYAARLLVLEQGRLLLDGMPEEVFANAKRMKALRLGVSQPREIAELLRQRGIGIAPDIVRYDELLTTLTTLAGGGGR